MTTYTECVHATDAALKSYATLSRISGVSVETLHRWSKHNAGLFNIIVIGCAAAIVAGADD